MQEVSAGYDGKPSLYLFGERDRDVVDGRVGVERGARDQHGGKWWSVRYRGRGWGQWCTWGGFGGANTTGPVPLVVDLRIAHDRFESSPDPSLNGHLHYPNDIEKSQNETSADKIRKYRADYANNPPSAVSFMPPIGSTSGRLHGEFIRLLFLQTHRETDLFFSVSGVQLAQTDRGLFHFRRVAFSDTLKAKVGSTLTEDATLRITLNIDRESITSRKHTHPSHSQTSRLLASSLSLGVPVPRATQCM